MSIQGIDVTDYRPEYGLELVKMWRQSFQRAMSLPEQNRIDEIADQLDDLAALDSSNVQVAIDTSSSTIAGFMVLAAPQLDHLYIDVRYQGLGLGSQLLNDAKAQSPKRIELFTFQKNTRAQSFYESHGFIEIERGFADMDDNPWASSAEDLADIKYVWAA